MEAIAVRRSTVKQIAAAAARGIVYAAMALALVLLYFTIIILLYQHGLA